MEDALDVTWRRQSEEMLSGMKEWRLVHPKAMLREIEQEASERVSRLQARLVHDIALNSASAEWSSLPQHAANRLPQQALTRSLHLLKQWGSRFMRSALYCLQPCIQEIEALKEPLEYLCKREAMMQYPRYQREGWSIGSGMVESANKTVMQARLKGAGMHWVPAYVNPMLALRTAV